jgi:acyl-coenzyme A synthetase/AMP-(fatty) acid ligase
MHIMLDSTRPPKMSADLHLTIAAQTYRPDDEIGGTLERLADAQPAAPALHVPGRTCLTYADLGAQIRYVRGRLSEWDIGRGDIVAGVIPLRPEMAVACATLPAAATFAPLSPAFTTEVYCELPVRCGRKCICATRAPNQP